MERIVASLPDQILEGIEISKRIKRLKKPDSLILVGMGGSGIAGEIFRTIYQSRIDVPIITHHSYGLPEFVSKKAILILISYSGNTEEVLSTFKKAKRLGLNIVAISSDGILSRKKVVFISMPPGLPPRGAFGYLMTPIPFIVYRCGLISDPGPELMNATRVLRRRFDILNRDAKKIARRLYQRFPFIYATTPNLLPIAHRWSCQLNENAKIPAHLAYLPEMDHNEIVGLEGLKGMMSETVLVILRDSKENKRIKKRVEITKTIIKEDFADVIEIKPHPGNLLIRYLSLIWLGDLTSIYLARLRRVDPFAINRINQLKEGLKR